MSRFLQTRLRSMRLLVVLPLALALILIVSLLFAPASHAQTVVANYPTKPIRIIMPYAPGGGSDIIMRLVAERLSTRFGQPVLVDSKPGASGVIGTDMVAKATPDGYTLLMSNSSIASNPWLYKLPFDTQRDLIPVTIMASAPNVLVVNPAVPAKNLTELIAWAKANPGKLSIGTSGPGQGSHLASEMLKQTAGIDALVVQYKGTGASMADLLAGHVMASFGTLPGLLPQIKAGKLRAIGVASTRRAPTLPDVQTMSETLPSFETETWFGIFAPAGTPKLIVDRLQKEISAAVSESALKTRVSGDGYATGGMSSEKFAELMSSDLKRWQKVIKDANIKIE